MQKPIIGIILDWEKKGGYSKNCSWYALRENYITAIEDNGGCPILLPYCLDKIDTYIKMIDGLVIPGGDYDIDPQIYGDILNGARIIKSNRFEFEKNMFLRAVKKEIPILGICAGMQLINVIYGGTLYQDINKEYQTTIEHEQTLNNIPHNQASHNITIIQGTKLAKISNITKILVNSTHHQAIKKLGNNLIVSAKADDGIIEAIEHNNHRFLIGVEWHPEYLINNFENLLFQQFIIEAHNRT